MSKTVVCNKCGSTDLTDVTGTYDKKSGIAGAGIGGVIGTIAGGPLGLLVGAGIGALTGMSGDSNEKELKCNSCGKRFSICPKCNIYLKTTKFNNLY